MALSSALVWLVVAASLFMLLRELYRRFYLDFDDADAVHTTFGFPLWNRPDIARVDQVFLVDTDFIRKSGKKVVRYVNPIRPWERVVAVADAQVLREMFVGTQWEKFQRTTPMAGPHEPYAGGLIFMPNGEDWRAARAMFDRTFTNAAVRSYVPMLNEKRTIFMEQLAKAAKESPDGTVEIQALLMRMTFDVISRLAFGEEFDAQRSEKGKEIMKAWEGWFASAVQLLVLNLLLGETAWQWAGGALGLLKPWNEGKKVIYGLIEQGLQRRRDGIDLDRISIMDDTLRSAKMPEFMKDDETFKKHLCTILFAGHDTTSGTLACAVHYLGQNPSWQAKIRKEVADAVGKDGAINALEPIENLPSLNAVIKETMRLLPSAAAAGNRYMMEDLDYVYKDPVDGREKKICFRKGDWLFPMLYTVQRHPDFWKGTDPEVFDPQRWIDDPQGGSKHLYAYAPFGNGPRKCVGEKLALGEMRLVLASILQKYDIVPGKYEFVPKQDATISAKYGVHVKLVPVSA
ncbi:cytochrome P450 [Hyaloraphidium curvatum]|nr:cytochrome P450 [Hyaloraphidium curvatum]